MITEPQAKLSWAQSLRTTDHRTLAIRYLSLSLIAVAAGTLMSLVMRIHLVYPDRILHRSGGRSSPKTTSPLSPCTAP